MLLSRILPAAFVAALIAAPAAEARDVTVTSFDGTQIVAHWFPAPAAAGGAKAPTVMTGPGWGSAGADNPATAPIKPMLDAGYNVLTWDPRGFGKSGGVVNIDSPQFEGRDAQKLVDWIATQPEVQLDGAGDPRLGMTGGSYGGGIQWVLAALDKRVDAIVPNIAWNSLRSSLYRNDIVKTGWSGLLYNIAATRPLDPHIKAAYDQGTKTGSLTAENERWFASRGPGDALISKVTVPTLIQQGTVDTLFTLDEAIRNYTILKAKRVPVSMLWFCGGHGACLTDPGDETRTQRSAIAWLNRYVKKDASVKTGPGFDWVDQNGERFTAAGWPIKTGKPVAAAGRGRLRLVAAGGSGPAKIPDSADVVGKVAGSITPGRATNAVNVTVRAPRAAHVVGAPRVVLSYRGRTTGAKRPERVFAQLVDAKTGLVLGNHVTPIPVKLDGKRHKVSAPLETVAHTLPKGGRVVLQLVATTVAYAQPRLGGSVTFDAIGVALPTAK
ncbi:MAG TPA: alpha/beta fold hydrolase [Solirubrobacteraceae bacterium]|nr:alpha/beta fold hydrolase [Solirubrobacteraceae bacterium]